MECLTKRVSIHGKSKLTKKPGSKCILHTNADLMEFVVRTYFPRLLEKNIPMFLVSYVLSAFIVPLKITTENEIHK